MTMLISLTAPRARENSSSSVLYRGTFITKRGALFCSWAGDTHEWLGGGRDARSKGGPPKHPPILYILAFPHFFANSFSPLAAHISSSAISINSLAPHLSPISLFFFALVSHHTQRKTIYIIVL